MDGAIATWGDECLQERWAEVRGNVKDGLELAARVAEIGGMALDAVATVRAIGSLLAVRPDGVVAAVAPVAAARTTANASNYRSLFLKSRPDLPSGWAVHHSMPQKYEELMRSAGLNIHDVQFLRGVDPQLHARITTEWARFDRAAGGNPSAARVADFAKQIDERFGGRFVWPGF
jgi:hypothetical protein